MYNRMVIRPNGLDLVFSALSDPHRRRMVERLARRPMTVGEVADGLPISQPAASKHVKILERSGLISRAVRGREHVLQLTPQAMRSASDWMEIQRQYWLGALERLDAYFLNHDDKETQQ